MTGYLRCLPPALLLCLAGVSLFEPVELPSVTSPPASARLFLTMFRVGPSWTTGWQCLSSNPVKNKTYLVAGELLIVGPGTAGSPTVTLGAGGRKGLGVDCCLNN